jgi:hypothetical protein
MHDLPTFKYCQKTYSAGELVAKLDWECDKVCPLVRTSLTLLFQAESLPLITPITIDDLLLFEQGPIWNWLYILLAMYARDT